jgi:hypothetical protein
LRDHSETSNFLCYSFWNRFSKQDYEPSKGVG